MKALVAMLILVKPVYTLTESISWKHRLSSKSFNRWNPKHQTVTKLSGESIGINSLSWSWQGPLTMDRLQWTCDCHKNLSKYHGEPRSAPLVLFGDEGNSCGARRTRTLSTVSLYAGQNRQKSIGTRAHVPLHALMANKPFPLVCWSAVSLVFQ